MAERHPCKSTGRNKIEPCVSNRSRNQGLKARQVNEQINKYRI
jgi:hypothetical protein